MLQKYYFHFALFWTILATVKSTPLDDYVWAPDNNYNWEYLPEYDVRGNLSDCNYTGMFKFFKLLQTKHLGYYVNMTSQQWLTDDDFAPDSETKSIWWHILVIIVPDQVRFKNNASLYITGVGRSFIKFNDSDDITMNTYLACATKSIYGVLFQVPNESVKFKNDPTQEKRSENAVIAYTWHHFLNNPTEPNWIILFPMTKAAVRAMDTMTAFVNQHLPQLGCQLDNFLVFGGSKRCWTTYLTAAMDPIRVKAIVPIVLDAINFVKFLHMQYRKYGAFSFALSDFIDLNITMRIDDPNMGLLTQYMDPYYYFDRLTIPKMVINAAMDELQHPDDTHNWWNELPEPKNFLLIPNAEHSMATGLYEALPAIAAFAISKFLDKPLPQFSWTRNDDTGEIIATVENDAAIHSVNAWWAYSCGINTWDNNKPRRDFRLINTDIQYGGKCYCGNSLANNSLCANLASLWNSQTIQPTVVNGKRTYTISYGDFNPPSNGTWIAYMIDFKFENPYKLDMDMREYNRLLKEIRNKRGAQFIGIPEDVEEFLEFTTDVAIWPNTYPYSPCLGESCGVRMV